MLRHWQCRRIAQLRRLIQYNMPQMRRQRWRLLGILIQIRHGVTKDFLLRVHGVLRLRLHPFFKVLVSHIGLKITHVDEVIDAAFDIGHGGLIRRKSPFVVNDEFKRVFALAQVVDVGEVVTATVHGDLPRPIVECARDVHLTTAMFPSKHGGDGFVVIELERGRFSTVVAPASVVLLLLLLLGIELIHMVLVVLSSHGGRVVVVSSVLLVRVGHAHIACAPMLGMLRLLRLLCAAALGIVSAIPATPTATAVVVRGGTATSGGVGSGTVSAGHAGGAVLS